MLTAVAAIGLLGVLGGMVPRWAQIPVQALVSVVLAGWFVAIAFLIVRHPALRGRRRMSLAVHAAGAGLTAAVGTALVYASVHFSEPEAVSSFVRGPIGWVAVWWVVLYGLFAALTQAVRTRERLRDQELAAARAELQALRAQLDPHFLFNTLHSLGALVRGSPALAEDALERFAELMRYLLRTSRAGEDVSLEDEMRFVRNYLTLEKLRLGERLRIVEDVAEDALDCRVPALVLQPLVENAVRHGIAPCANGGTVRVTARCESQTLLIGVEDDGQGSDPDGVARSGGLALRALKRQLAVRFASAHRFEVHTGPGRGFEVRIALPADPFDAPVVVDAADRQRRGAP